MSAPKEPGFFLRAPTDNCALNRYKALFDSGAAIRGESSVNYSKAHLFPHVPIRIHSLIPGAKILYVVSCPFERIVSHYVHNVAQRVENDTLSDAISLPSVCTNKYVLTSCYLRQISEYLNLFPICQVYVLDLQLLAEEPFTVMRDLFSWLGVDSSFQHDDFHSVFQPSSDKRRFPWWARLLGLRSSCKKHKPLLSLIGKRIPTPRIDAALRRKLNDLLHFEYAGVLKVASCLQAARDTGSEKCSRRLKVAP